VPRIGQVKPPAGERLPDRIAIGLLTATFPPELVDRVVAETGRVQQRSRLLPARVMVYYVLAMCLFFGQGYEEVARLLTDGLAYARRWRGPWQVPTTAAITRARARLGPGPLRALFAVVCAPLAAEASAGAFYRRWRLVAVDGTTFDLPDTAANAGFFGRPGSARGAGNGAFPQVRVTALAECGTHAIFAAALDALAVHETELARRLFGRLRAGMLLLADRGFTGVDLWRAAAATGADLLWRVKNTAVLPVMQQLADGSYLSRIYAARDKNKHADPATVRVIEYTLAGQATVYRLITTILDPAQAPALDLAALYAQRWEFETSLDELKTHQGAPRLVLRSQTPEGVQQEVYGFLLVHYAIRTLMHQAALDAGIDPDRVSFTRTLRLVRRQVTAQAALSPLTANAQAVPGPG
jgi:Insertion element 4 transposase N-terminal/Transposase DDE domain